MGNIITFEQILDNTTMLDYEKEAYQQALNDDLDIETHYYNRFHVFGNEEQRAFYAKKWKEAYQDYDDIGE
ncbi:hypothetical protein [Methanosarcina mazei]|jgi:hypothetical protein|uniref:hypothetical protein n=1 Tax=Methanosarcina mazei TaxID=2209 RepID=UPI003C74F08F